MGCGGSKVAPEGGGAGGVGGALAVAKEKALDAKAKVDEATAKAKEKALEAKAKVDEARAAVKAKVDANPGMASAAGVLATGGATLIPKAIASASTSAGSKGGASAKSDEDDDEGDVAETKSEIYMLIYQVAEKYGLANLDIDKVTGALAKVGICNTEGLVTIMAMLDEAEDLLLPVGGVDPLLELEDEAEDAVAEQAAKEEAEKAKLLAHESRKEKEARLKAEKQAEKERLLAEKDAKKAAKEKAKKAPKKAKRKPKKEETKDPRSGLEEEFEEAEVEAAKPKGYINTMAAVAVYKEILAALEEAGAPPTLWTLLRTENSGTSVELRTWRFGAQFTNSHRIYLNSDGVIKETKSSMGMKHKAEYFKVKTGITDFTKKSRMGSSDFTFKNATTGKELVFKKVKNAKQVFEFIEEHILNLDFPKGGHW